MTSFFSCLLTLVAYQIAVGVTAQQALSVDFTAPASVRFRGLSAVRHGFDYMPEETGRGLTPALRNVGLDRLASSRLAGARTWYEAAWVMPGGWGSPLNFTTSRFEQFAAWAADMQARNVSVILNTGWFFPTSTCEVMYSGPGSCAANASNEAIWLDWVAESVRELVLRRGLTNVDTLLLFTEPLPSSSWPTGFPPGVSAEDEYAALVRALHARLLADGTRHLVSLHGPNDGGLRSAAGAAALKWAVSELTGVLDIFTSHDYGLPGYDAWQAMFANATSTVAGAGDFWVDEGGAGSGAGGEAVRNASSYGTYIAAWQAALINAGAANSFLWLLQDQYYAGPCANLTNNDSFVNGLHRWGLSFWLPDAIAPRPAWYVFDIMSRFLRPPAGAAGRFVASFGMAGAAPGSGAVGAAVASLPALGRPDYAAILLVNEGNAAVPVTVALHGSAASGFGVLRRYAFDPEMPPSAPIEPSAEHPAGGGDIVDVLTPGAVVVWAADWQLPAAAET